MHSKTQALHVLITTIVVVSLTLSAYQAPVASAQGQQDDGIVRQYNSETNKVTMISGANDQPIQMLSAMGTGMTDEQRTDILVQSFAPEFGITNPATSAWPFDLPILKSRGLSVTET